MKKFAIALAACGVAFIAFVVALALTENIRGRRAWEAWKASRQALGDSYEWAPLLPPPVPDEENFAVAPGVAAAIPPDSKQPLLSDKVFASSKDHRGWSIGAEEDLQAWADAQPGKDLDRALEAAKPALQELEAASLRPASRLPVDHPAWEIPSLLGFRTAGRALRVRAIRSLRAGRSHAAAEDILVMLRVAQHLQEEPCLIASLLRAALLNLAMQPIWEGVRTHRWADADLRALQEALSREDLLRSYRKSVQSERLHAVEAILSIAEPVAHRMSGADLPKGPVRDRFLNLGWVYRNLIHIDQYYAWGYIDPVDSVHHRVFPAAWDKVESQARATRKTPYTVLYLMQLPALADQMPRCARTQAWIDMATVACALERYRLQQGKYPDALQDLVPTIAPWLPGDLTTGDPLHYHCQGNATYTLYAVGWDGKDDGGTIQIDSKTSLQGLPTDPGDWVWPQLKASAEGH